MKKLRTTILAGMLLVSIGVFAAPHYILTSCGESYLIPDAIEGEELADMVDALEDLCN